MTQSKSASPECQDDDKARLKQIPFEHGHLRDRSLGSLPGAKMKCTTSAQGPGHRCVRFWPKAV